MKKLEDIKVTFIWGGREVTAWGDCDYQTHKIDIGPEGYREHVMADVPYDMSISRLQLTYGDAYVTNPEPELLEFAEQLLIEEADEQLCETA
ncbi:MAG: hypothetical protein EBZ53_05000 [Verrucomicrobia bacterium]|nr:hypothetical protein [Verrucomicrobiota bacterium]